MFRPLLITLKVFITNIRKLSIVINNEASGIFIGFRVEVNGSAESCCYFITLVMVCLVNKCCYLLTRVAGYRSVGTSRSQLPWIINSR